VDVAGRPEPLPEEKALTGGIYGSHFLYMIQGGYDGTQKAQPACCSRGNALSGNLMCQHRLRFIAPTQDTVDRGPADERRAAVRAHFEARQRLTRTRSTRDATFCWRGRGGRERKPAVPVAARTLRWSARGPVSSLVSSPCQGHDVVLSREGRSAPVDALRGAAAGRRALLFDLASAPRSRPRSGRVWTTRRSTSPMCSSSKAQQERRRPLLSPTRL
jgi:hypothetical protein